MYYEPHPQVRLCLVVRVTGIFLVRREARLITSGNCAPLVSRTEGYLKILWLTISHAYLQIMHFNSPVRVVTCSRQYTLLYRYNLHSGEADQLCGRWACQRDAGGGCAAVAGNTLRLQCNFYTQCRFSLQHMCVLISGHPHSSHSSTQLSKMQIWQSDPREYVA